MAQCSKCRFVRAANLANEGEEPDWSYICRRYPPVTRGDPAQPGAHPLVLPDNWCGEYQRKPT